MKVFIAEKPSLGRAIADGLGGGQKKDGYIECSSGDVVTWCFGHLLELVNPDEYNRSWKVWSKDTLPIVPELWRKEPQKAKGVSKQLKIINKLLENCTEVVNAGDPDREGQLIVDEVLEYLGYSGASSRIWLAALDPKSVAKALASLKDNQDYKSLKISAEARARADWLYGINTTRALTIIGQGLGIQGVLSGGRVQTATLNLLGQRAKEIEAFKSQDYWTLKAHIKHDAGAFDVSWSPEEGLLTDKALADKIIQAVSGQSGAIAKITKEDQTKTPPLPHCLSSLQAQANKAYGLSAKQTLDAAQKLYEAKCISYPRSDCRYLPEEQFSDAAAILDSLKGSLPISTQADPQIQSKAWNTKKVTAHHAIIPTGVLPDGNLDDAQAFVYSLVIHAYVRQFFAPFKYEAQQVLVELPSESGAKTPTRTWKASGRRIIDDGWTIVEKADEDPRAENNQTLPEMNEGDVATCEKAEAKAQKTKPPALFTEGTLITAMANVHKFIEDQAAKKTLRENEGIGTEATRANTLETLKKRAYISIKKNKIFITALGENVLALSPDALKDPVTTAIWERQLDEIAKGKLYLDRFLQEQAKSLPGVVDGIFASNVDKFKVDVHKCPECDSPMRRMQSKKDKRKHFWACMNKEKHADGKPVFLPDVKGKPGQRQEMATDDCPTCGKTMRRLDSKKKKGTFFWACESGECPLCSDDKGKPGKTFGN